MTGALPEVARRPGLVTASTVLVIVAAVVNASIGPAVLAAFEANRAVLERAAAEQGTSPAELQSVLVVASAALVVVAVIYAVALVVLALLFRSGRPWARVALFAATLLSPFALFVPNLPALVVVVLLVVADVMMYRPVVTRWVRSLRGLGAG